MMKDLQIYKRIIMAKDGVGLRREWDVRRNVRRQR